MPKQPKPWVMPEIKAEYVGLREIAKRFGCSPITIKRRKAKDPSFPIARKPIVRGWAFYALETSIRLWELSIYEEATAYIKARYDYPKGKRKRVSIRVIPPCGCEGCLADPAYDYPSTYSST